MFWIIPTEEVLKTSTPRVMDCFHDWQGCRGKFPLQEGRFACWGDDEGKDRKYAGYCSNVCFLWHCDAKTMTVH